MTSMRLMKMPSIKNLNPFSQAEMALRFARIQQYWWVYFTQASTITKIPIEIIMAKAAVESAGLQQTSNAYYVGLMQVGKATIQDALNFLCGSLYADGSKWKAPDWLVANALPIVLKYLPNFKTNNPKSINPQLAFQIAASKNGAEFNVLMGSLYLYFLLQHPKFIDNGIVRLDKVMSGYNTGPNLAFYAPKAKPNTADTLSLLNTIKNYPKLSVGKKQETSAHILKFCGVGGAFDLLFNGKFQLK